MKSGNFNWFLHAMLFYHTQNVIQRQKETPHQIEINEDDEGEEHEENNVEKHWDGEEE